MCRCEGVRMEDVHSGYMRVRMGGCGYGGYMCRCEGVRMGGCGGYGGYVCSVRV